MNTARGENTVRGESRLDGIVRQTPVEEFEADAQSPGVSCTHSKQRA